METEKKAKKRRPKESETDRRFKQRRKDRQTEGTGYSGSVVLNRTVIGVGVY